MHKNFIQLMLFFKKNGQSRAEYLKRHVPFKKFGTYVTWRPLLIPSEPEQVSIGSNVHIAANVRFITHDMFHLMFNAMDKDEILQKHVGEIQIGNNVAIGANVTLVYGTKLGDDTIVAAGAVVTKPFPAGVILGGNPAQVIGRFDELKQKRYNNRRIE
ncbi:acyltransferase [Candidatus Enterococcus courvalinii]|uniref:Acyltransferase n=1 Tax=Candidatus Enterococcus courvalinii TaxID=2815329 RepID=A0ABS3HX11_9ENTE|nr:acyltransferase [Enterococcus sp. MSG2901]MBO0481010.1 acyltransferase [Enterococcus sp. MSG2901]